MFKKFKELFQLNKSLEEKKQLLLEKEQQVHVLEQKIEKLDQLVEDAISPIRQAIEEKGAQTLQDANQEAASILTESNIKAGIIVEEATTGVSDLLAKKELLTDEISKIETQLIATTKELAKYQKTAKKHKAEILGIKNFMMHFPQAIDHSMIEAQLLNNLEQASIEDGVLETIVHLHLHHKDSKALRSEMNAINKDIRNLLAAYQTRYSTKANTTIYQLMVIGLQAELQNILYTLSYSNLDKAIENSKLLIEKYLKIAANGNANILPTITRFLSELEPLFEMAIRVEYKYYVQKELEKEEQRKIREIMRQEAEEKRILEEERKKLDKEEEKYRQEIAKNIDLLQTETDEDKIAALGARLRELEDQCHRIEETKEEIIKRANGKAGYVYVISNLGSFGDNMFKVGMTRRLNPLDRVDELGDASVPFRFDVHALMFSDDAVGLEQKLHETLETQRVNKINLRKEFFYATIDELQNIVQEIDPTIEFIQTMAAMEYRQSLSVSESEEVLELVV